MRRRAPPCLRCGGEPAGGVGDRRRGGYTFAAGAFSIHRTGVGRTEIDVQPGAFGAVGSTEVVRALEPFALKLGSGAAKSAVGLGVDQAERGGRGDPCRSARLDAGVQQLVNQVLGGGRGSVASLGVVHFTGCLAC